MKETLNSLSYDVASLDWQALEKSVNIAYQALLYQVKDGANKMTHDGDADYIEAARMARRAKDLVIVAETYHAIQGANCRRKLEIINKATELAFTKL